MKELLKKIIPEPVQLFRAHHIAKHDTFQHFLRSFMHANKNAQFIQVGSNDGVSQDPIRDLVLATDWKGILVEPLPHIFKRLKANYAEISHRLIFENAAVSQQEGVLPMYFINTLENPGEKGLPDWYELIASLDKDFLLSQIPEVPNAEAMVDQMEVPCLSVKSICDKHDVGRLDFMHVDAEGHDFDVIQSVDLDSYCPYIIIYEHDHMSAEEWQECSDYLAKWGFDSLQIQRDTWCVRLEGLEAKDKMWSEAWRRYAAKKRA